MNWHNYMLYSSRTGAILYTYFTISISLVVFLCKPINSGKSRIMSTMTHYGNILLWSLRFRSWFHENCRKQTSYTINGHIASRIIESSEWRQSMEFVLVMPYLETSIPVNSPGHTVVNFTMSIFLQVGNVCRFTRNANRRICDTDYRKKLLSWNFSFITLLLMWPTYFLVLEAAKVIVNSHIRHHWRHCC